MQKPIISLQEAIDIAKIFVESQSTSTFCLLGQSGFGKSTGFMTELSNSGYEVITIYVGDLISGVHHIPNVHTGKEVVTINDRLANMLSNWDSDKKYIILLEEVHILFSFGTPLNKQILVRQLLLEKVIGSVITIPPNVKFILLGNTTTDSGSADDEDSLPPMLSNVISFFQLKIPSIPSWLESTKTFGVSFYSPLMDTLQELGSTFPNDVTPRNIQQLSNILQEYARVAEGRISATIIEVIVTSFFKHAASYIAQSLFQKMNGNGSVPETLRKKFRNNGTINEIVTWIGDYPSEYICDFIRNDLKSFTYPMVLANTEQVKTLFELLPNNTETELLAILTNFFVKESPQPFWNNTNTYH